MSFWGATGVAWFELRRSLSLGRFLLFLLLAFFPMVLVALVRSNAGPAVEDEPLVFVMFFLIVRVACVMGLLLWATPVINNEMEGRTWIYLVTRPNGGTSVVLGKFAVALLWSLAVGLVGALTTVSVSGVESPFRVWWVLSALAVLSCMAYGALFTFIGTVLQRRAMVAAILVTLVFEGVLASIPATINRFTVGYRLFSLLMTWMGYEDDPRAIQWRELFGETSPGTHLAVILVYSLTMLALAVVRVRLGGYLTEPED